MSILFPIEIAASWINGSAPYKYNAETDSWDQPEATATWLDYILTMNKQKLTSLELSKDCTVGRKTFTSGESLANVVQAAVQDPKIAVPALHVLLEELNSAKE
jgi:hypothetical protein